MRRPGRARRLPLTGVIIAALCIAGGVCGARLCGAAGASPMVAADGIILGVEDGTTKIFREPHRFAGARTTSVRLTMARNEVESFQIALHDPQLAVTATVQPTPLVHENGRDVIPASQISIREVRYVKTKQPDYPVARVGWWPDPLVETTVISMPAGEVQPVWVEVRTTPETAPGRYRGFIRVSPTNLHSKGLVVDLDVTVRQFALPVTGRLQTAFDLYPARLRQGYEQFRPDAYARWQEHLGVLEHRYFLSLLEHRMSPLWNTDLNNDGHFEERIAAYLDRGLTAFGIGTHGGSFDNDWFADPSALDRQVAPYRGMAERLERRQLLSRAFVYTYDEPAIGDPQVAQVAAAIHRAHPKLRNLVALGELRDPAAQPEWWKDLDIVCVRNTAAVTAHLEVLRGWGKEIWLYASGPSRSYPTLVLDYPAMAARILPWMCWKANATGFLYWCVNYWMKDPWTDPANTPWGQNANGSLFYPGDDGPVASIRLAALRDGMEDYEYLALLSALVGRAKDDAGVTADPAGQALVARAERLLALDPELVESMQRYSPEAGVLERNRSAIGELIDILQQRLGSS